MKETLELYLKYILIVKAVALFFNLGANSFYTNKALVNCVDVEQRNTNCLTISVNDHVSEHCNTGMNSILASDPDIPGKLHIQQNLSCHYI